MQNTIVTGRAMLSNVRGWMYDELSQGQGSYGATDF